MKFSTSLLMLEPSDTIAAIATPPGEGGISIIRISGKEAIAIADKVFSGPVTQYKSHTCHLGQILDRGEPIDTVLLIVMKAPRSYTGEDTVEIQCHGGSLVTRQVLDLILTNGARPAGPGYFTYRAFCNGKLDLAQAEAVQSFIGAKNHLALQAANQQLGGKLSEKIAQFQHELIDAAAILEAWVDFPEEGLEFATVDEIIASLDTTLKKMRHLEATFHEGKKIDEGITLCLCGSPNAGKSSLLNALLGHERAIVTEIAGTTRDTLDAEMRLGGLHFRLVDTAGIRDTNEIVEKEGIKRSLKAIEDADLILWLVDASKPLSKEDTAFLNTLPPEKTLLIWNKIDLPHHITSTPFSSVSISAKTGDNLELLKTTIEELIWQGSPPSKEEVVLTNVRHKQALTDACKDLDTLIKGLHTQVSPEFLSSDMRSCLKHLSRVIGQDISEEILSAIFSKFCVGK